MYIERVKKGKHVSVLLRESRREGQKIVKTTIANLSKLSPEVIDNLQKSLKGSNLVSSSDIIEHIECADTAPWGHVEAVLTALDRLGFPELIDPEPSDERRVIMGVVAARVLRPWSEDSTSLWRESCSLSARLGLNDYDENDICQAMDWLLPKRAEIEKRLASRHLNNGDMVFLDISSSLYEGSKSSLINQSDEEIFSENSSLIRRGYSRDKNRGQAQINYSLLTDKEGRPISIKAYPGDISDASIILPALNKVRKDFGLSRVVLVGGRGLISDEDITMLRQTDGVDWISASRSTSIKSIVPEKGFQFKLFDEYDLCEFTAPEEYPSERLAACVNPELQNKQAKARESLIEATKEKLDKIVTRVKAGRLKKKENIALAVGRVIDKNKVNKYFILEFGDYFFNYSPNEESINKEKTLDGIYVIRTSLPVEAFTIEDCVRQYKNLSRIERAFRTIKSVDLRVGPIDHRLGDRIRAHLFLTMLAYYVEWHLREVWRKLTVSAPNLAEMSKSRNPVSPARKSEKAVKRATSKMIDESSSIKALDFGEILANLATISEVTLVLKQGGPNQSDLPFKRRKKFSPFQEKALKLLEEIPKYPPR
ncbi:MAG: IS1634 family transposase [Deltaproteobacteria bacterium]|jgi:transposase|nr:IS1634 family transposase [Deltaproteobacteria bacterium]